MRRPALAVFVALATIVAAGRSGGETAARPLEPPQSSGLTPFADVTRESGLDFVHVNGATGDLLLPEVIGGGGALFDYDNDGDLDVFAVQGAALPGPAVGAGASGPRSRLFRNDPAGPERRPRFTDVTERSGLAVSGYGMGAATGDVDNDGWIDLYVTMLGSNRLLRNNGDGTFRDVTDVSGTGDPRWSTSATFFDYDRDGWLDLFVVNYVEFSADMKRACFSASSARDYCNPAVYAAAPDRLFHNDRDGTFTDVTSRARAGAAGGRGLGVLAFDANEDGWSDVFVANDGDANHLWINQAGTGTFTDDALLTGVALNRMGQRQGSMGVDAADYDGDGDEDLFVTNLDNEGNTLYRNTGGGLFEDRTVEAGLFALGFTGFGTRFADVDNDGWHDLIVANGAVRHAATAGVRGSLRQRNQLFRNDRGRRFSDAARAAPGPLGEAGVGRGLATGDLDNDGDLDLVVFNNNGPLRVLLNESGHRHHWLGIRVVDKRRDALQARVVLAGRGGTDRVARVHTDGSYATAGDPRVVFGLGVDARAATVRVHWPGGPVDAFPDLAIDRYWTIERDRPPRAR